MIPIDLHPDRLFPAEPSARSLARALYATVRDLPIVSPHGHTDPQWFADNARFADPSALFIVPDHYVFRMLYSQGVSLAALGVPRAAGTHADDHPYDARAIWRTFAAHYPLFRATPTRLWLDHAFHTVFGIDERLTPESADRCFDRIAECLADDAYRPRALFERFNIEVLATTESPLDALAHHQAIRASGWTAAWSPRIGRIPSSIRSSRLRRQRRAVRRIDGREHGDVEWYLAAHRIRRAFFQVDGRDVHDHGHLTARTLDLDREACQRPLDQALRGTISVDDAESFARRC
jgi:glucuronate isomerase